MGANLFGGPSERVGPENCDFFGPKMAASEAGAIWAQKSREFQGRPLPLARVMDLSPSKS
jgi:hypothetical protein